MVLPTGAEVSVRITLVLTIERGHWRIVQWHGSIGEKDEVSFGRSLTKNIDLIERSVRDERPGRTAASW